MLVVVVVKTTHRDGGMIGGSVISRPAQHTFSVAGLGVTSTNHGGIQSQVFSSAAPSSTLTSMGGPPSSAVGTHHSSSGGEDPTSGLHGSEVDAHIVSSQRHDDGDTRRHSLHDSSILNSTTNNYFVTSNTQWDRSIREREDSCCKRL